MSGAAREEVGWQSVERESKSARARERERERESEVVRSNGRKEVGIL